MPQASAAVLLRALLQPDVTSSATANLHVHCRCYCYSATATLSCCWCLVLTHYEGHKEGQLHLQQQ